MMGGKFKKRTVLKVFYCSRECQAKSIIGKKVAIKKKVSFK